MQKYQNGLLAKNNREKKNAQIAGFPSLVDPYLSTNI